MRFRGIDLIRYGAFTEAQLRFREGAKLHLVSGANERGKTTLLLAFEELLYGIDARTPMAFRHDFSRLLIGGEIVSSGGEALAFQRRKGNKATLARADGTPLAEAELAHFLGGLSAEHFRRAFGLTAQRLRSGADALLADDARDGAALFAASSGMHGIKGLITGLADEADKLFGRKNAAYPLNEAIRRSAAAVEALRKSEQRASEWIEATGAVAQLEQEQRACSDRLAAADRETAFLQSLIRANDALQRELGEQDKAAEAVARAQRAFDALPPDDPVLDDAEDIAELRDVSSYRDWQNDIPRIGEEARGFTEAISDVARRLGHSPEDAETRQPPVLAIERVKRLRDSGRKLADRLVDLERRLKEGTEALAEGTAPQQHHADPAPLRLRLDGMRSGLKAAEDCASLSKEIAAEREVLAQRAAALDPPVGDAQSLGSLALPSAETIQHFVSASEQLGNARATARDAVANAERSVAAARAALLESASAGKPVTTADVSAARESRNLQWRRLARHVAGEEALATPEAHDLATSFGDVMRHADALSDAAADHKERAARVAGQQAVLDRAEADLSVATRRKAEVKADVLAGGQRWEEEWRASGVAPKAAWLMAKWRIAVDGLVQAARELAGRSSALAFAEKQAEALIAPLAALARDAGLTGDWRDSVAAAAAIEARLKTLESEWQERRTKIAVREKTEADLAKLTSERDQATANLEEWRGEWAEAAAHLGMPGTVHTDDATAVIAAWSELPGLLKERDNRNQRIDGMKRRAEEYKARADALIGKRVGDAGETNLLVLVQRLAERFDAAKVGAAKREASTKTLEDRRNSAADAAAAVQLARAKQGEAMAQLASYPAASSIPARLAGLQALKDGDLARLPQLGQDLADSRRKREAMEKSAAAEHALAEVKQAEAQAVDLAREWVVLKLAGRLVTEAVRRHRKEQEGRLLARAGGHFSTLTGGRFRGLETEFDSDDKPILTARRADGEGIAVARLKGEAAEGLSEGTRDQVYLALRLAFLEDYASRAEPLPFIGDDILVSFDDERTGHALEALAGISRAIQPIIFTHHGKVVDIARARLGNAVDVIEL